MKRRKEAKSEGRAHMDWCAQLSSISLLPTKAGGLQLSMKKNVILRWEKA